MNKRGFTLIELLVVIAIIAILAAILFPVFVAAKDRATSTNCLNNLKQLHTAVLQYCDDYNGTTPLCYPDGKGLYDFAGREYCGQVPRTVDPVNGYDVRNGGLFKYVRNKDVFRCPVDVRTYRNADGYTVRYNNLSSYSMNCTVGSRRTGNYYPKLDALRPTAGPRSKLMLLIQEKENNDSYCVFNDPADIPGDVHYDGTNLVYVDGHAMYAPQKRLIEEWKSGAWTAR